MNLSEFCAIWPKAVAEGWYLKPGGSNYIYMVCPPKNHKAHDWAATWTRLDMGSPSQGIPNVQFLVPHWFEDFFPK